MILKVSNTEYKVWSYRPQGRKKYSVRSSQLRDILIHCKGFEFSELSAVACRDGFAALKFDDVLKITRIKSEVLY